MHIYLLALDKLYYYLDRAVSMLAKELGGRVENCFIGYFSMKKIEKDKTCKVLPTPLKMSI